MKNNSMILRAASIASVVVAVICAPKTSVCAPLKRPASKTTSLKSVDTDKSQNATVDVLARGVGKDRANALKDAFRDAVERAVGVYIDAEQMVENYKLVEDRISSVSNADIMRYDVLEEGKDADGLYQMRIRATVERKAIAKKFKGILPSETSDVTQLMGQIVSEDMRTKDGAALLMSVLKDFDPIRHLTKLSLVQSKTRAIAVPKDCKGRDISSYRVPQGKKLMSITYSISFDMNKYFNEFLPRLKKVLEAVKVGPVVAKNAGSLQSTTWSRAWSYAKLWNVDNIGKIDWGEDCNYQIDYLRPLLVWGLPSVKSNIGYDGNQKRVNFSMEDKAKWSINPQIDYIWVVDGCAKNGSRLHISAYPVPQEVFYAYRDFMKRYLSLSDGYNSFESLLRSEVTVAFCDENGEEIASEVDPLPLAYLMTPGETNRSIWFDCISTFIIKPFFLAMPWNIATASSRTIESAWGEDFHTSGNVRYIILSDTIERQLYMLIDAEDLPKIKSAKVEFTE